MIVPSAGNRGQHGIPRAALISGLAGEIADEYTMASTRSGT